MANQNHRATSSILIIVFLGLYILNTGTTGCSSEKKEPVITRDTTITQVTAVTRLLLDSNRVENFISSFNFPDSSVNRFRNFYISRNFQFAWFNEEGITQQARAFWNLHNYYINFNRDSSLYDKGLQEIMTLYTTDSTYAPPLETVIHTELQLTQHFFQYAQLAYAGKIDPAELQWHIPRKKLDVVALLDSLVRNKGNNLKEWEPVNEQYLRMQNRLVFYAGIEKQGGWDTIAIPKNFSKRSGDSLIFRLKKRLYLEGDLSIPDSTLVFDSTLETAVKKSERRYGLKEDGIPDKSLITALNIPVNVRIEQILLNMERMRWLPAPPGKNLIVANIPDFRLRVYEDTGEVMSMNIVVGKEGHNSVIFTDVLKYVVFAPYWNVPMSIAKNEIMPAMKRNPNYIKASNMEITGYSNGVPVVRQLPGPKNALGQVKFIFPNSYNIYFHDTPSKSLFTREQRAFSHGCIRLHEPFKLAKYLLRNSPGWTDEKINEAMNDKKEKWITLPQAVPVFITYFTAYVDYEGSMHFAQDIYGHDKKLAERLFF